MNPQDKTTAHPSIHLQPTNTLPPDFKRSGTLVLDRSTIRGLVKWNAIGGIAFVLVGGVFLVSAIALRPELSDGILQSSQQAPLIILGNLTAMAVAIVLHEMMHGLLFWVYTRTPPVFGAQIAYTYTAAPGWYLPRGQYLLVMLAPLVFLTLSGYGLMPVVSPVLTLPLLFGMATNVVASISDVAVAIWVLLQRYRILIEDMGGTIQVYSA